MKKVLLIIYSLAIIFTFGAVVIYLAPNILTKESDSNEQDNNETVDFIEEETKDFDFNLEDLGENSYRLTVQIPNEFLGLDLVLAFDPTKIQVDEVIEGNMLKKHIHELDNEKGYVILSGAGREEGLDASEYFYDLKITGANISKSSFEIVERSPFTEVYSNYLNTDNEIVLIKN